MRDHKVAARYAQALFEASKVEGGLEDVADSYAVLMEAFAGRSDLAIFMESPQVASQEKQQLIDSVLGERVEPVLLRFMHLLIDKNRIEFFRDIGEEFAQLVEQERGFRRAIVTTAIPLANDLATAMTGKLEDLTGSKIILEKKVDPAVIGGVCVTLGDKILDGTVRTNLELLRNHLEKAQVR